jgi:hypothetical protein
MTQEKKKRGRPRKENWEAIKEVFAETPEIVQDKIKKLKEGPLGIGQRIDTEKLLPPAGLSKVATLQWLTANKK